ncbi:MAG: class I SAM-dependent methyltransferase [Cyclobacteriaceae bacterium]|nr:class I SAM-dependent methyltransferase [Cyclobacteriaceae bacterium]
MKDLFSQHASQYAQFRPVYPKELYDFIYAHVTHFGCAWDAGTGNGQAANELAKKFITVLATDISSAQLNQAIRHHNIQYSVADEVINHPLKSVDLITVAQAIHWFDRTRFFECVKKVGKPDAIIAVWGYGLLRINPTVDSIIDNFYYNVIGSFWDPERKMIDDHYRTIPFPFSEIEAPLFSFSFQWPLEQLHGYLNTWSAVRKYIQLHHTNPVDRLIKQLQTHWLNNVEVTFPLFLRIGRVH